MRNLSAQCIYGLHSQESENDLGNLNEDLSVIEDGTSDLDKNISMIYLANSEGFALVSIENIVMDCSSYIVDVDVVAEGDTLFVDPKIISKLDSSGPVPDCLCPTLVSFNIERTSKFSNANYLVYQNDLVMPLENR